MFRGRGGLPLQDMEIMDAACFVVQKYAQMLACEWQGWLGGMYPARTYVAWTCINNSRTVCNVAQGFK